LNVSRGHLINIGSDIASMVFNLHHLKSPPTM
jgi:hypothetical protein